MNDADTLRVARVRVAEDIMHRIRTGADVFERESDTLGWLGEKLGNQEFMQAADCQLNRLALLAYTDPATAQRRIATDLVERVNAGRVITHREGKHLVWLGQTLSDNNVIRAGCKVTGWDPNEMCVLEKTSL